MNSEEETDFTWNVAFQSCFTETEQVVGLKEDIKIMIFFLNVVHRLGESRWTCYTPTKKPFLELKYVGIQISACMNIPLNVTYISQRTMAHISENNNKNELVVQISENKADTKHG